MRMRTIHYCSPDLGHDLHHRIGMGRVPGWFILVQRGCIGRVLGPFPTEEAARAAL
jgi:hypothetical protein